jgi:hypothetical protein
VCDVVYGCSYDAWNPVPGIVIDLSNSYTEQASLDEYALRNNVAVYYDARTIAHQNALPLLPELKHESDALNALFTEMQWGSFVFIYSVEYEKLRPAGNVIRSVVVSEGCTEA